MRILQVVSYYPPAWGYGGPPRVMYELARRHVRNGHSVTVYTTDACDERSRVRFRHDSLDGIDVHYLPNLSNRLAWKHKKFLPIGARRALQQAARKHDIVHIVDSRAWLVLQGYRAARRCGVPYVLSAFGSLGGSPGLRGAVKRIYDARFVRPMVRCASALLAQTDHEASVYRQFGGAEDRIAQIPLGFDAEEFRELPARGGFRSQHGFSPDDKIALFIGRLHPTKGLDFLLRCIARLFAQDPAWRLVLIGVDNGMLETIRTLSAELGIGSRVTFLGALFGKDRFAAMVDADVFAITSSIYEETSQASIEAAAAGVALVVTEQADVPFLNESGGGCVVPRTEEAVTGALARVVADHSTSRRMGEAARQLMLERFTWGAVTRRLEDVLLRACSIAPCASST